MSAEQIKDQLREKLAGVVGEAGKSQAQLARDIGMRQPDLNTLVNGKRGTVESLVRALERMGVKVVGVTYGE